MRDDTVVTLPAGAGGGAGPVAPAPDSRRPSIRPRPLGLLGRVYLLVVLAVLPALGVLA
jgi:hypothetical protein